MNKFYLLFSVLAITTIFVGCNGLFGSLQTPVEIPRDFQTTVDTANIADYFMEATTSPNPGTNEDTVLLGMIGGPINDLDQAVFGSPENGISYFIDYESIFRVYYVHQAQTYSSDLKKIMAGRLLSESEAEKANAFSAEILIEVAKHFKSQNKKVFVIGHSFGSFIIPLAMIQQKASNLDVFDKIVLAAGRLNMEQEVIDAFKKGIGGFFDERIDNTGQVSMHFEPSLEWKKDREPTEEELFDLMNSVTIEGTDEEKPTSVEVVRSMMNGFKLQAAIGQYPFIKELEQLYSDLSHLLYAYGTRDYAVGPLSQSEIAFLNTKNATIQEYDADHNLDIVEKDGTITNTAPERIRFLTP